MPLFLQRYWLTVSITLLVLILLALEPLSSGWLQYQRELVNSGQVWRLFTPNLVHLGLEHTLMNLASLWLISLIFRPLLKLSDWSIWLAVLFLANIIGMHFWLPNLTSYVGMSGALYGLIAACCVAELRLKVKISGILLVIVGVKIFAPQIFGIKSEYDEMIGGYIVEESHIIGYLQGMILGLVWPKSRLNQPAFGALMKKANN